MATIAQTATATNDANAATYNYTTANGNALPIGADGGNDVIRIGAGARTTDNASTATVTIDGVTADLIVQHSLNEGSGIRSLAGIWAVDRNDLPDPSQTDIDVVIIYNTGCLRNAVAAAVSADTVKAATDTATQDAGSAGDLNVDTTAGGVVMGFAFNGDNATFTWSGLTEETDAEVEGNRYSSAYASNVSAETPRSVDFTIAPNTSASVAASFAAVEVEGVEIPVDAGEIVAEGQAVGILSGDVLVVTAGEIAVQGQSVEIFDASLITVEAGQAAFEGQSIVFVSVDALGLEEAMIAKLLATPAVTDLVATRVYPGSVPQASAMPAIVVNRISGTPIYTDDGESGLQTARLELDCWGETYSSAKTVARAVIAALSGFVGIIDGVELQNTLLDAERDMREGGGNAAKYLFRTNLDFIVWFKL